MSDAPSIFNLPDRYSFDEDTTLRVFLQENSDRKVMISAQNLRRIDSLLVQYLIAAARRWMGRGLSFQVIHLRAELARSLALLGVTPDLLAWSAAE
jgi:anti-anti-sigma regulatory factor